MSGTFPPLAPTTLSKILKAYVYKQYEDDDNIQAFNAAFNGMAQNYLDYVNGLNLPVYTKLTGPLLDWVAQGLYGMVRPSLPFGSVSGVGLIASYTVASLELNQFVSTGSVQTYVVNDDMFRRIITWTFFKGDGFTFSMNWLKRRIMRFLVGTDGAAPNIDNTYPVSVAFGVLNTVFITVTVDASGLVTLATAQVFQAAIQSGALDMPFQFEFSVTINNTIGLSGLANNGGVIQLLDSTGYPIHSVMLLPGQVWDAFGAVYVVPGITPDPAAPALFFGVVTAAQLLALGGGDLPLADPAQYNRLWNNDGIVCVSLGIP